MELVTVLDLLILEVSNTEKLNATGYKVLDEAGLSFTLVPAFSFLHERNIMAIAIKVKYFFIKAKFKLL
jgi:hypothetical protein